MPGTKQGGKKAARTFKRKTTRRQRRLWGAQGGKAKVAKGFAVSGKASAAGQAGGKAKAIKYQDPNFDKGLYRARRAAGLPGQDKPNVIRGVISPEEHLRRTNPAELDRQKGGSNVKVTVKSTTTKTKTAEQNSKTP